MILDKKFKFDELEIEDIVRIEFDHPNQDVFGRYWYGEDFKLLKKENNELYFISSSSFRLFLNGEKSHIHEYIGKYVNNATKK